MQAQKVQEEQSHLMIGTTTKLFYGLCSFALDYYLQYFASFLNAVPPKSRKEFGVAGAPLIIYSCLHRLAHKHNVWKNFISFSPSLSHSLFKYKILLVDLKCNKFRRSCVEAQKMKAIYVHSEYWINSVYIQK